MPILTDQPRALPPAALGAWLPPKVGAAIANLAPPVAARYEEIRMRLGRPLSVAWEGREHFVAADGRLVESRHEALAVAEDQIDAFIQRLTEYSLYAWQEELRFGYLTLPGGDRVGLAGEVQMAEGRIVRLRRIIQVNIRRSRSVVGCAVALARRIVDAGGRLRSTLIVSPPGCGKTTLLRDLARLASDGCAEAGIAPHTVGLVDERGELAAVYHGLPQHDVGARTDVVSHAPKPDGLRLLLRAMSPQIVVTDEIGGPGDAEALAECTRAGVRVLATAHAGAVDDVLHRPSLRALWTDGAFERVALLSRRLGPGTLETVGVLNGRARPIR